MYKVHIYKHCILESGFWISPISRLIIVTKIPLNTLYVYAVSSQLIYSKFKCLSFIKKISNA